MMLTAIVAAALFLGMVLILWQGYQSVEAERQAEAREGSQTAAVSVQTWPTQTTDGRCVLCDAPLRRGKTSSEVVGEVERRIDAELAAVERFLREPRAEHLTHVH